MTKKQLSFSGIFLYLDNKELQIEDFKAKIPEGSFINDTGSKVQIFELKYENNYLKINFGDGTLGPRNPMVFNFETHSQEDNPREKSQIETRHTFAIIDFKSSFLWISNSKKRNGLIDLLKLKFKDSIITAKDIYDEDEFIKTLNRLDKIKISAVPNLLSETGVLSKKLAEEINGYEADSASLILNYNHKLTTKYLIDKVKSIFEQKNSLKGIVISGRDHNNLGMLFNTEGFSRKIDVEAKVDEDEMFCTEDLFQKLITNIEIENS